MKKMIARNTRSFRFIFLFVVTMHSSSPPALAYEEDTHFLVTYVMLRSVGYTHNEALLVAAVDQGLDDSPGTVANGSIQPISGLTLSGIIPNINEEWMWHALDQWGNLNISRADLIIGRKDELFQRALDQKSTRDKLIYLGIFFHFQQDTWSHRHHMVNMSLSPEMRLNHLSYDNYSTYLTPLGHAQDIHQPDRPPFDPLCAIWSMEDGIAYASKFLKLALGRPVTPWMINYFPMGAEIDETWPKQGRFIHQVKAIPPGVKGPRRFVNELIRAQIETYTYSRSISFLEYPVADEADFTNVRGALQVVCDSYQSFMGSITIPSKMEKQVMGFTNMTSDITSFLNPNLALNKPARQSSVRNVLPRQYQPTADKAVDGHRDGYWNGINPKGFTDSYWTDPDINSKPFYISATNGFDDTNGAWWEVDLGLVYDISSIRIYGVMDYFLDNLKSFFIYVSPVPLSATSPPVTDQFVAGPQSVGFTAGREMFKNFIPSKKMTGRYVRIWSAVPKFPLALAEVQVYGDLPSEFK